MVLGPPAGGEEVRALFEESLRSVDGKAAVGSSRVVRLRVGEMPDRGVFEEQDTGGDVDEVGEADILLTGVDSDS